MRRNFLLVTAACLLAAVVQAQGGMRRPVNTLESLLRVSALLGQPASALGAIWPIALEPGAREAPLHLTGADLLVVTFDAPASGESARVSDVRLMTRVADTLALRRRVAELQSVLTVRLGAPDRCAGPPGAPAHLHAPQEASRLWTRGLQGSVTRLLWSVGPSGVGLMVQLQVGVLAQSGVEGVYRCGAPMP